MHFLGLPLTALLAALVTTACGSGETSPTNGATSGSGGAGGTSTGSGGGGGTHSPIEGALLVAYSNTCWLSQDGRAKCWGEGSQGQLGHGDTDSWGKASEDMGAGLPTIDLGAGRTVRAIAGDGASFCALLDSGDVKCWGSNLAGRLGLGDQDNRGDNPGEMGDALPAVDLGTSIEVKALEYGGTQSCAISSDGGLKCWGTNGYGQLGLGDQNHRGDTLTEMGDALPFVDVGTGRTVTAVAMGTIHTCALLDGGQVKCWGDSASGKLGSADGHGSQPGGMGDALPVVNLGTGRSVKAISAGYDHTCALLDNDEVKCWGRNDDGQLGLGDKLSRGSVATEMSDALPSVDLGAGRTAKAISAGGNRTCVVLDNDKIKCWGNNIDGALGLGDILSRGDDPGEMGDALPEVDLGTGYAARAVDVGAMHACALLDDGKIKCWGNNVLGQLGLGSGVPTRGTQPGEMGDVLPFVDVGP